MRKTLIVFSVIFFFGSSLQLISQNMPVWYSIYNGPYNYYDDPAAIAIDSMGNVFVSGTSAGAGFSPLSAYYDFATVKYNSNGVQQWVKRYNYNLEDEVYDMKIDRASNVYVTGSSVAMSGPYSEIATVKYDNNGNQLWVQRFYDSSYDYTNIPYAMILDSSSNLYIAGVSNSRYTNHSSVETIKYNTNGTLLWHTAFTMSNSYCMANSITSDKSGNIYVGGSIMDSLNHQGYLIVKYNPLGIILWSHVTHVNTDYGISLVVDRSLSVYLAGYSYPSNQSNIILLKVDSIGVLKWVRSYPGKGYELTYKLPKMLALDGSGNIYINGETQSANGHNEFATLKYDSNGDLIWARTYNAPNQGYDIPSDIVCDRFSNVYVTGVSNALPYIYFDTFVILKYDSSGNLVGDIRRAPSFLFMLKPVAIAVNDNNIFITGSGSDSGVSETDFYTIKYSQPIGIRPISSEIPNHFSLSQNYPNPFNPSTKIKFDVPVVGDAYMRPLQIIIYDVLGREVAKLVNEQLKPGSYEISWDASNYPSGVYFYRLNAGEYTETKKMVLLK